MQPQIKKCPQLPQVRRAKCERHSLLQNLRREHNLEDTDFGIPASRALGKYIHVVSIHEIGGNLLQGNLSWEILIERLILWRNMIQEAQGSILWRPKLQLQMVRKRILKRGYPVSINNTFQKKVYHLHQLKKGIEKITKVILQII